jgi:hypothetical protein
MLAFPVAELSVAADGAVGPLERAEPYGEKYDAYGYISSTQLMAHPVYSSDSSFSSCCSAYSMQRRRCKGMRGSKAFLRAFSRRRCWFAESACDVTLSQPISGLGFGSREPLFQWCERSEIAERDSIAKTAN